MAHVRIISVENPNPGGPGTGCDNYRHSKFVIRRKYVETELIPAMRRMPYESVNAFRAVVDPDITNIATREGEYRAVEWNGIRFKSDAGGYIPCFLSNYSLWQECVATGNTIFIMEDDARMPEGNERLIYEP